MTASTPATPHAAATLPPVPAPVLPRPRPLPPPPAPCLRSDLAELAKRAGRDFEARDFQLQVMGDVSLLKGEDIVGGAASLEVPGLTREQLQYLDRLVLDL